MPAAARPPRLTLRFALYTAIAFLLAGSGIILFIRHEELGRAERETAERAARVSHRLSDDLRPSDFKRPLSEERRAQLDKVFARELRDGLVRAKLWARDGTLVYSDDHALIGTRQNEPEFHRVLAGEALSEVTRLAEESPGDHDLKVLENFIPVRLRGREKPAGALELYSDYEPITAQAGSAVKPIALALGLAWLLLYAALLPILRQVTKALESRNRRLTEQTEQLQRTLEERHRAERRLSEAERNYRSLVEQLPLVTYIDRLDETSSSIYMSPQVEEMLGYPVAAWLADPEFFPKVLHPEDRERVLATHHEAYSNGHSFSDEYRLVARDGRVVWVSDEVMIARDPQGRPLHAQGFLVDISERKRAEEQLERRHDELTALHETALMLIDELDAEKLLERIVTRAGELVGTDNCYVYLREEDGLAVRLGTGVFADKVGYRLRKGEGLAGRVWETGEPLAVEDYHTWDGGRPDLAGTPFHAVLGVPLFAGREVVGVLGLGYDEEGRTFGEADTALLSRFAHLASLALESARLYEAVRVNEEKFKALVSNVPGAIFRCAFDADWTMEFLSDAIEEIAGYSAADFIHNRVRTYASIVHPEDTDTLEDAVGEGRPYSVEYRLVRPDGSIRWVLERGQGVHDADGELWLEGAIFDITEQKAAEDQRLQLAAIVESSDDAIIGTNFDDVVVSWNSGAERMYGYTAAEAIGRPISIIVPDDRRDERPRWLEEMHSGKPIEHNDTVRLRKSGEPVDVSVTLSPIRNAAGEVVGASTIARDVTERRRSEEALRESETKFRSFIETTEEWVWAIDERGVTTYCNPAIERILGYTPEELVGRDSLEHVHPEDREQVEAELATFADERSGWSGLVLRWRHKDGTYRHLESNATPILDADGGLRGWRGTDRDVTQRIRAEAERERLLAEAERARAELSAQNERLLELDRLKDEFIALVSHELRTPLTSIRGYVELLRDGAAGDLNDEQLQFLNIVERNSHRLLHLVGDLLFLAQIEAGKLVLELGALDLGALASESVEAARPSAEEKGVTVTLATGPVSLLAGDRARIAQLFDNLVSNGVKFTPAGGRVDVRVRGQAGRAVLEVRDSGIGIPPDERPYLFERFFRTSNATQQAIQGTGLGLAISKAIVEAHGGAITVESKLGAGTTFRVELPLQQSAAEPEEVQVAL